MATENKTFVKDPNEIGLCWSKTSSKTSEKYLSGFINIDGIEHAIAIFKVKVRDGVTPKSNAPQYRILKSNYPGKTEEKSPTPVSPAKTKATPVETPDF